MPDHPIQRRRVRSAVALVAAGLIGGLGATAATASFNDVPDEGAYAEHIENLQEAGIATGYADGSFRPTATMNRRQTAAWLDRTASRVGLDLTGDETIILDGANPTATIAEVEMTSPAAGDGSGWVVLQGGVGSVVTANEAACPCAMRLYLRNSANEVVGTGVLTVHANDGGFAVSTSPIFAAVPLAAGDTETFRLDVELLEPSVTVAAAGMVFGTYTPLADGEPEQFIESDGTDRVESLVPEIPFTGAP